MQCCHLLGGRYQISRFGKYMKSKWSIIPPIPTDMYVFFFFFFDIWALFLNRPKQTWILRPSAGVQVAGTTGDPADRNSLWKNTGRKQ